MADDTGFKIVDPDQALLAQLKAKGVGTATALPVGIRIDFDPQVARQAAADLILGLSIGSTGDGIHAGGDRDRAHGAYS